MISINKLFSAIKKFVFKIMAFEEVSKKTIEYRNGYGDFTKERQKMNIIREEFLKYALERGETID